MSTVILDTHRELRRWEQRETQAFGQVMLMRDRIEVLGYRLARTAAFGDTVDGHSLAVAVRRLRWAERRWRHAVSRCEWFREHV